MRKTHKIKLTPEAARAAQKAGRPPYVEVTAEAVRAAQEAHRVQVRVRLDPPLLNRLEQESDRHRRTFNAEVRLRLEASFEHDALLSLKDICTEQRVAWGRFAARFLRMELADELADA